MLWTYSGCTERQIANWESGRGPFERGVIVIYEMATRLDDEGVARTVARVANAIEPDPDGVGLAGGYAPWDLNPEPAD